MAYGVVFDCDGTLLDSTDMWLEVQAELGKRAGATLTDAHTKKIGTLTIPEVGEYFSDSFGLGECGADVVAMMDDLILDYYKTRAVARPGALEFVEKLCELGVRCSVASSSPQPYLQAGLRLAGFTRFLDAIVSVEDVGISKREPAVYDQACQLMGMTREQVWVFEDSLYALHTLSDAGYRSVGIHDQDIAGTFEELGQVATIAVHSFAELDPQMFAK